MGLAPTGDQRLAAGQPGLSRRLDQLHLMGQPGLIQIVIIKLKINPFAVQALFKASTQLCQARAVGG